jgi:tungstate transport system substrate-binding protein
VKIRNSHSHKVFQKGFPIEILLLILTVSIFTACVGIDRSENPIPKPENAQIILATTTSTQDSGLLDFLLPDFQEQSGYLVKTIAVGTGKALKMAEDGNADVLLVHAPVAEKALVEKGFGIERQLVMYNDFVITGPPDDPAEISGIASATEALRKIMDSNSLFISRGDDSGTHKKEIAFWGELEEIPAGDWYLESGQGMGSTLRIASEKGGYTLTDRATYLANQELIDSIVHVEGDRRLLNVYHVMVVNPRTWPEVNYTGAQTFAEFLVAAETQSKIGSFGIDRYGQSLFTPTGGKTEGDLGLD